MILAKNMTRYLTAYNHLHVFFWVKKIMGVEHDHYVIVGIKTGFNELEKLFKIGESEDLEDHLEGVVSFALKKQRRKSDVF